MQTIDKIARTLALTRKAYADVEEAIIECAQHETREVEYRQLLQCKRELQQMLDGLESGQLPPGNERVAGMGRMIVDIWPFNSALGRLLLEAEQSFREL